MRYALHLFPQFADMDGIEHARARYDPLFGLIPPHITLVFPFDAETDALIAAMEQARKILQNTAPFRLETKSIERQNDFLWLLCGCGKEEITHLHDELYTHAFAAWYAPEYVYVPHITLGRGKNLPEDLMLHGQSCMVDSAVLERICDDERSEILETIRFEGGYRI